MAASALTRTMMNRKDASIASLEGLDTLSKVARSITRLQHLGSEVDSLELSHQTSDAKPYSSA